MFSESQWQELKYREAQFAKVFAGERPDFVPVWFYHEQLGQMKPELLMLEKDRDAWLANQVKAVQANVAESLDGSTLYYPLIEMASFYGTHYIDALFGNDVQWVDGQFWSKEQKCEVSELQMPDLDNSPLLAETLELATWIKGKTEGRFVISMPDVGSPINVAINLFGERFFLEIAMNPEQAQRVLNMVARVTRRVYEELIKAVGQETIRCHNAFYVYTPYNYAGLSLCATQMISPSNFGDLVADADDASVPDCYEGMIQHLCGSSDQHVEEIAKRNRVKGVQLNDNGADQFESYFKALRQDQIFYLRPTENMPVEKILSITGGERLLLTVTENLARDEKITI
ncbi:MAG: hypothetical protein DRP83_08445 [Planctomycetota bacterium]|nr:MAG: hypothetical protein DRP83_08445 [Planctomycetota bacterium]